MQSNPGPLFAGGVGGLAGLLSGLLGIGGGLVVGPALILRGVPLPSALGTSLQVVVPVACVGVATELLTTPSHLVVWAALLLALGGQIGAPLGARLLVRLPSGLLRILFAAFLLYAGLRNLGVWGGGPPAGPLPGLAGDHSVFRGVLAGFTGVAAGICSSLFGVGGGVVAVPGLVFIVGGFPLSQAAGTSLLAMIPTAALGVFLARRQGRLVPGLARHLMPAAVIAAAGAVLLRNRLLAPRFLAVVFGIFLLLVAARLFRRPSGAG